MKTTLAFEKIVNDIMECYKHINLSLEDAKQIAKIKNEDYQMEILELMETYNMNFKSAKKMLS
jgi:hypothetical protein